MTPWDSTASAARCASVVRLPPLPRGRRKEKPNSACRGPGLTTRTIRRFSRDSTCAATASTGMGLAKTRGLVHRRTYPSATTHDIPTGVLPERLEAHHLLALSCQGEVES